MAKFTKTVNIWDESIDLTSLQRGQWVKAGEHGDRGIFGGITKGGSVIVAWYRNAKLKRHTTYGGYRGYIRALMDYARTWSV